MGHTDILVVGAGPAGATAAYVLARAGASVALVDRAARPGAKPCGGGLSPAVRRLLDFDCRSALSATVTRLRFAYDLRDPMEAELELEEPVWMVRREAFDGLLLRQAVQAGAAFRPGLAVTGLAREGGLWRAETPEGPLCARFLLAADGAKGPCARLLGFRRRYRVAGALEAEHPTPPADPGCLHLDFGVVGRGYAWNFPKRDGQSLGVGVLRGRAEAPLGEALRRYAGAFGLDLEDCPVAAHPILLWDGDQRLHGEACLLAGEAACVVDPFTAEGIRPSLQTGLWAAESLRGALEGRPGALEAYTARVHRELGRDLAWARRLSRVFYAFPERAYALGVKHPGMAQRMAQLLCGELRYADVAARALARLGGRLLG